MLAPSSPPPPSKVRSITKARNGTDLWRYRYACVRVCVLQQEKSGRTVFDLSLIEVTSSLSSSAAGSSASSHADFDSPYSGLSKSTPTWPAPSNQTDSHRQRRRRRDGLVSPLCDEVPQPIPFLSPLWTR